MCSNLCCDSTVVSKGRIDISESVFLTSSPQASGCISSWKHGRWMFVWKSLKSTSSWLNSPDKEMEQWAGTAKLLSNTDQRDGTFHNGNTTERNKWWGGMCSLSAAVMSSVFVSMTSVSVSDSEFQFRFKSTAAPSWRCRGYMDNRPVTVTTRVTGRYHKMAHQRRRYVVVVPAASGPLVLSQPQLDLHCTDCSCVKCLQKMHAAAVIRT